PMRSFKSGLLCCAFSGLLGAIVIVGCSADGASQDVVDPNADANGTEPGSQLPPSSNPDDDADSAAPADAGKKDAGKDSGKTDAGKDAGPPPPDEGTACSTPNQIFKRTCGFCGTQEAICLAGDDGGAAKVSPYGECNNQVDNGCKPGATDSI